MTTPNLSLGARFRDNCGRVWEVDNNGQLRTYGDFGVLVRNWHSLDACAGPLQPVADSDTTLNPGDKYRDKDGDVWVVHEDGDLFLEDPELVTTASWDEVNRENGPLAHIGAQVDDGFPAATFNPKFDSLEDETPAPNYYQFPCGAQVIEISRYLTSNAGQAVQYIARSSRIDGVVKEDPLGDLYKARDMIRDEIERLELAADRARNAA